MGTCTQGERRETFNLPTYSQESDAKTLEVFVYESAAEEVKNKEPNIPIRDPDKENKEVPVN